MVFTSIILYSLIVIGTFLFWEFIAWFSHKYVMHGFLWKWHKSHHTAQSHLLEKNDWFAVVFSIPSIGLIYYASLVTYNPLIISIGIGIFVYGLFYLPFHDVIVHQRIKWRIEKKGRYLQRMINAHHIHHSKHTKEGCEAFGFLIAPKKYEPKIFIGQNERTEKQ